MGKAVPAAERILDILLLFTTPATKFSVDDICQQIDLPKSTTYRYVAILQDKGFLEKSGSSHYALGPQVFSLGRAAFAKRDLAAVALPSMEHIGQLTGETVLLTKISGRQSICIERVDGQHNVRITFELGHTQELHAGASSRLLLAYQDQAFQDDVLRGPLPPYTENTIADAGTLRAALADVVQQGYCVSYSEVDQGAIAVAVPIFNRKGHILAALSTAGPAFRMDDDTIQQHLALLQEQAAHIQKQLVYSGY